MPAHTHADLEKAWQWRQKCGILPEKLSAGQSPALRIFHGPGEGQRELRSIALDRFGDHYWLTEWENSEGRTPDFRILRQRIIEFLKTRGAKSLVGLSRPEKGIAPECETFWGTPPEGRFEVQEGEGRYWIQFQKTRHPGLFLDHEPLRRWLSQRMKNLRVLNTFAYTGSLSVAAALGGAREVTTLDLSRPSIEWAQDNFSLNGFASDSKESYRWIVGDVFEWLPRLKREKQNYDCIILDPPSFSHGKKQRFSTSKDLAVLHSLVLELLAPEGFLVTSINSANISWEKFEADLGLAAKEKDRRLSVLSRIDLPETFPTRSGSPEARYLKGWILRSLN